MKMNLFDFLMFVFTFLIALGVIRSIRVKNKFAIAFGLVSLAVFLFADGLIIYYATKGV
ncbi:DUF2759 family protein [Brevibacillus composti]|uniref:DUF2759 family protein n=1 Tax=Brevibacillus composti TaxID=2796470 RepID=A0A7T5JMD5_9BACL|nr:DUF2759 family protein [Brevibacillus composti]QQE72870.1 DUF2759 family protein [Brevibacillus composti]QUO39948.1 DUF2759 family protein [Brevibacillus composti]